MDFLRALQGTKQVLRISEGESPALHWRKKMMGKIWKKFYNIYKIKFVRNSIFLR